MSETVRSTLANAAYNNIKNDIIEGYLRPGEKVKIKELGERYNVSETPIKQALAMLTSEGLIENIPRKGMRIKMITWEEIDEIFDIRLMMELFYKSDIITAVKYNSTLKKALEENVHQNLELINNATQLDQHKKGYQMDNTFHELYLKCSGNQKAVEIYRNLNPHAYSNYIYGRQPKEKTLAGISEHQQIVNAIIKQDEDALEEAIRLHIENAKAIIQLLLKVDSISMNLSR